ncbi:MAG: hypothetical protein KME05_17435 [Gloeocapsa sp. UFS-A4-WI-NPMV-4B04]|jgi:hypothetical protein|nr:hypothetical protein [Gloeocapsa sp. UFS-A4-WI-NPMV-4B04]
MERTRDLCSFISLQLTANCDVGGRNALHKVDPLRLSIQGTRQHLDTFIPQLAFTSNRKRVQLISCFTQDNRS